MTCPECYNTPILNYRELPMNEAIREYTQKYVSPVKMWYKDLEEAEKAWRGDD